MPVSTDINRFQNADKALPFTSSPLASSTCTQKLRVYIHAHHHQSRICILLALFLRLRLAVNKPLDSPRPRDSETSTRTPSRTPRFRIADAQVAPWPATLVYRSRFDEGVRVYHCLFELWLSLGACHWGLFVFSRLGIGSFNV